MPIEWGLRAVMELKTVVSYNVYRCSRDYQGVEPVQLYIRRCSKPIRVGIFNSSFGGDPPGWAHITFRNHFFFSEGVWVDTESEHPPETIRRRASITMIFPPDKRNPQPRHLLYFRWCDYQRIETQLQQHAWPQLWGNFEITPPLKLDLTVIDGV